MNPARLLLIVAMCASGLARVEAAAPPNPQPSPAMMAPVRALAACMAHSLPTGCVLPFAQTDVVISENFAPYVFRGADAVEQWRTGFLAHLAAGGDANLDVRFGPAQDFSRSGTLAYFSLPTTWTGIASGYRFRETGGWSFVVVETPEGFRIASYAWAVTGLALTPIHH